MKPIKSTTLAEKERIKKVIKHSLGISSSFTKNKLFIELTLDDEVMHKEEINPGYISDILKTLHKS